MLFTKGDRQELMENSLEQKNRSRDQQTIWVFLFLLLLNLEGKAAFFPVLSKVKCLIKWKRFKVTHK